MFKIKKVKITKTGKINIEYESFNNKVESWDEYSFTCSDEPRPEFKKTLSKLSIVEKMKLWEQL